MTGEGETMENTALVPVQRTFPEALADLAAAIRRISDAWRNLAAILAEALKPAIRSAAQLIDGWRDAHLRAVATGREWHLMQHARKARTRKKYRNRLLRRWLALLASADKGEDADELS